MSCPICGHKEDERFGLKSAVVFLLFGLLIGFLGGQLFVIWQVKPIFQNKLEYLDKSNKELKKGYVPPKGSSLEY